MSFPLSPTNGQLIVVNGINYIWDASKGAWRRVQTQFITNFQNAYDTANAANVLATASFAQANTINVSVSAAYTQANTNATAITLIQGVNVYQNTAITNVGNIVSGAFTQANAANNLAQSAYNAANSSSGSSAAFAQANAANNLATSAYGKANSADTLATASYSSSNTNASAITLIQGVDVYQNTVTTAVSNYAVSAYAKANAADSLATSAYTQANNTNTLTGAAFVASNTNSTAITLIQGVDVYQNTRITSVDAYATSGYGQANAANGLAAAAFAAANSGTGATFAYTQANAANNLAQSAYNNSNTKIFIFYQNTAPTSANVRDGWVNSDTGTKYQNLSNTTPLWVELGPTTAVSESPIASAAFDKANTAITTSGGSITGSLNVAFSSTGTGYPLSVSAANTQGGTGYADFLKATNTSGGATNPNKSFRLSSAGAVEIINSAYNATILSLSDTGGLSVPGPISISGKQAVNGPAFSAYANSTLQTITSGSQQKVLFQTEEFDTNSNFANSRFTPTVEGYYQLNAEVRLDGATGTGECMIILYKNGSEYKRGWNSSGTQFASNFWAMQVSSMVYANGTSDYFEIYVQQGSGGSVTVTAVNNPAITWFNGCMLRGA